MENKPPISLGNPALQHQSHVVPPSKPLSPENIRANAAALRAFPNEKRALLSVQDGQLERLHGIDWAIHYAGKKEDLDTLQATIYQTFDGVLSPIEQELEAWNKIREQFERSLWSAEFREQFHTEEEFNKGNPLLIVMTEEKRQEAQAALKNAEEMLKGLGNLHRSLSYQYRKVKDKETSPEHRALIALESTIDTYREKIHQDQAALKNLEKSPSLTYWTNYFKHAFPA